jgi:hypothetical protein
MDAHLGIADAVIVAETIIVRVTVTGEDEIAALAEEIRDVVTRHGWAHDVHVLRALTPVPQPAGAQRPEPRRWQYPVC